MPSLCEELPAPKATCARAGCAALQSVTAVGQHWGSPELAEALQMGDKQYFVFHSDVDYEPGKRKLKRWTASFGISWNLCIVSKESRQRGQATVWEFYSQ